MEPYPLQDLPADLAPSERPKGAYGCWSSEAVPHPWEDIADVACGYDYRLTSPRCTGCHRAREESTLDQLRALDARHTEDGLA